MKIPIEKELLLSVFDYIITVCELQQISIQKQAAVRNQAYDVAKELQEVETKLIQSMPTIETMKGLRDQIFNLDKPPLVTPDLQIIH